MSPCPNTYSTAAPLSHHTGPVFWGKLQAWGVRGHFCGTPWDEHLAAIPLGKHHCGFTPAEEHSLWLGISPTDKEK